MNTRLSVLALLAMSATGLGAVTPLWMRDVKISPDGSQIAFTYKGDIYKVAATGGTAVRLTSLPSYESAPVWSPDGKEIAFASDRNGGSDVFVMDANGGTARQLTFNSAAETPQAFTPDGKNVLFSASIQDPATSALFPTLRMPELYSVPTAGGRTSQVLGTPAFSLAFLPDGKSFLYEDNKGLEDVFRKHHTSSVTRDIWRYDASTGKHTNLTERGGEDRNPVLGTDGKTVYFLSERNGGTFNVYSMDINSPKTVKKLTDFTTHPVRFLSQGANGLTAFTYDGEIYTMAPGAKPKKVNINVTVDDAQPVDDIRVTSADEAAVSPDGKQVAFMRRGELFVTSTEHNSTKQVTNTAENESDVAWAPDGRTVYYTSERDGNYNIYKATIAREEDPNFSNATVVKEEPVFPKGKLDRTCPMVSPDGKKLAYILDRNKLMVRDIKTGSEKQLTDGSTNPTRTKGFAARWSPDSRWLAIDFNDPRHIPYTDIAIINAETGKLTRITDSGYFDEGPHWVLDGNAIIFLTERYGMRAHASWGSQYDVMMTFLNKDAYDKFMLSEEDYALQKELEKANKKKDKSAKPATKKDGKKDADKPKAEDEDKDAVKPIKIDFDGIEDRTVRLTPASTSIADAILSKDGETLYFIAAFENDYDLWKRKLRKSDDLKRAAALGAPGSFEMDKDGNLYVVGRQVKKIDGKTEKVTPVKFAASMKMDPAKEREYMLRHVYNEERERFYNPNLHGVNWDKMYADYAKFLPHINNNYDFANLLSELLGELNVSHTGGRYGGTPAKTATSSLGLLYDLNYKGDGLKVAEVIEKGPFDNAWSTMKPGAVITAINGVKLTAKEDPSKILNEIDRGKTLVTFTAPGSNASTEEVILPISSGAQNNLLYDRWVKQREHLVDSLSGGRLGYVHIKGMNDASFRPIYSKIMGKYSDRDGIVIDTRWNGGGRMHEDIEVFFSGKKYLTQDVHGVPTSSMPSRRWTKPSIMVICEANYSNAHGTPWVYKHQNIGKLVGMPVPGTMTSVNWVTLQDPSLVFGIPVIGFRTAEGNYLENTQLEPDVKVALDPATVVKGQDAQIEAAVKTLLNDINSKK